MTKKKHHCLIGNPPMQIPLVLFIWGAAGHPVWVAHEMVLEDHQLAYFCNGLINATAARPKVTSRPDSPKKQRWKCGLELWFSEAKKRDSERIRSPSLCSQQSKHWCQTLNTTWVTVFEARACANRRIGNPFPPSICADLDLQTAIPKHVAHNHKRLCKCAAHLNWWAVLRLWDL